MSLTKLFMARIANLFIQCRTMRKNPGIFSLKRKEKPERILLISPVVTASKKFQITPVK
jgi:hypothetical protein